MEKNKNKKFLKAIKFAMVSVCLAGSLSDVSLGMYFCKQHCSGNFSQQGCNKKDFMGVLHPQYVRNGEYPSRGKFSFEEIELSGELTISEKRELYNQKLECKNPEEVQDDFYRKGQFFNTMALNYNGDIYCYPGDSQTAHATIEYSRSVMERLEKLNDDQLNGLYEKANDLSKRYTLMPIVDIVRMMIFCPSLTEDKYMPTVFGEDCWLKAHKGSKKLRSYWNNITSRLFAMGGRYTSYNFQSAMIELYMVQKCIQKDYGLPACLRTKEEFSIPKDLRHKIHGESLEKALTPEIAEKSGITKSEFAKEIYKKYFDSRENETVKNAVLQKITEKEKELKEYAALYDIFKSFRDYYDVISSAATLDKVSRTDEYFTRMLDERKPENLDKVIKEEVAKIKNFDKEDFFSEIGGRQKSHFEFYELSGDFYVNENIKKYKKEVEKKQEEVVVADELPENPRQYDLNLNNQFYTKKKEKRYTTDHQSTDRKKSEEFYEKLRVKPFDFNQSMNEDQLDLSKNSSANSTQSTQAFNDKSSPKNGENNLFQRIRSSRIAIQLQSGNQKDFKENIFRSTMDLMFPYLNNIEIQGQGNSYKRYSGNSQNITSLVLKLGPNLSKNVFVQNFAQNNSQRLGFVGSIIQGKVPQKVAHQSAIIYQNDYRAIDPNSHQKGHQNNIRDLSALQNSVGNIDQSISQNQSVLQSTIQSQLGNRIQNNAENGILIGGSMSKQDILNMFGFGVKNYAWNLGSYKLGKSYYVPSGIGFNSIGYGYNGKLGNSALGNNFMLQRRPNVCDIMKLEQENFNLARMLGIGRFIKNMNGQDLPQSMPTFPDAVNYELSAQMLDELCIVNLYLEIINFAGRNSFVKKVGAQYIIPTSANSEKQLNSSQNNDIGDVNGIHSIEKIDSPDRSLLKHVLQSGGHINGLQQGNSQVEGALCYSFYSNNYELERREQDDLSKSLQKNSQEVSQQNSQGSSVHSNTVVNVNIELLIKKMLMDYGFGLLQQNFSNNSNYIRNVNNAISITHYPNIPWNGNNAPIIRGNNNISHNGIIFSDLMRIPDPSNVEYASSEIKNNGYLKEVQANISNNRGLARSLIDNCYVAPDANVFHRQIGVSGNNNVNNKANNQPSFVQYILYGLPGVPTKDFVIQGNLQKLRASANNRPATYTDNSVENNIQSIAEESNDQINFNGLQSSIMLDQKSKASNGSDTRSNTNDNTSEIQTQEFVKSNKNNQDKWQGINPSEYSNGISKLSSSSSLDSHRQGRMGQNNQDSEFIIRNIPVPVMQDLFVSGQFIRRTLSYRPMIQISKRNPVEKVRGNQSKSPRVFKDGTFSGENYLSNDFRYAFMLNKNFQKTINNGIVEALENDNNSNGSESQRALNGPVNENNNNNSNSDPRANNSSNSGNQRSGFGNVKNVFKKVDSDIGVNHSKSNVPPAENKNTRFMKFRYVPDNRDVSNDVSNIIYGGNSNVNSLRNSNVGSNVGVQGNIYGYYPQPSDFVSSQFGGQNFGSNMMNSQNMGQSMNWSMNQSVNTMSQSVFNSNYQPQNINGSSIMAQSQVSPRNVSPRNTPNKPPQNPLNSNGSINSNINALNYEPLSIQFETDNQNRIVIPEQTLNIGGQKIKVYERIVSPIPGGLLGNVNGNSSLTVYIKESIEYIIESVENAQKGYNSGNGQGSRMTDVKLYELLKHYHYETKFTDGNSKFEYVVRFSLVESSDIGNIKVDQRFVKQPSTVKNFNPTPMRNLMFPLNQSPFMLSSIIRKFQK